MQTTDYVILRKSHAARTHKGLRCSKVLNGDKWEGTCNLCEKYRQLCLEHKPREARQLLPIERHYFACEGEEMSCGKTVANLIGNKTGKFRLIKNMIRSGVQYYPCYDGSHFV